jgi:thymidylate synthase
MLKRLVLEKYDHPEEQYLQLIKDIQELGSYETTRNGKTYAVFGSSMYFSLENERIPILTTKKTAWKTCLKELLWFIEGKMDNKLLKENKVHIWNANGSRDFLDSRGLSHREDDLGPVYGHQWRFFNAPYDNCDTDYTGKGVDQLQYIIDNLKSKEGRQSRRLIMSAWNPCQLNEMALPPCHILCQFNVTGGDKLSCSLYQRSGDVGLGVPFNIASYSFLTCLLAKHTGLKPYEFVYNLGNCHIYEEHMEVLKEQVKLTPYDFPTLEITNKYDNINDYTINDFSLNNYNSHPPIKMIMKA